ncbi:unnamed protein product, partial [Rotaria sp. Silwood2]
MLPIRTFTRVYLLWEILNEVFRHLYFPMEKLSIQSYIKKIRLLTCLTATKIHDELTTAYGQANDLLRIVADCVHQFLSGRGSLADDHRSSRPIITVTQQKTVDSVTTNWIESLVPLLAM